MHKTYTFFLLLSLTVSLKIAIIGGGIGGSSSAHFLTQDGIEHVTLFEQTSDSSGRILSENGYELGASFFISQNKLIDNLVELYGLTKADPKKLGVNNQIVFTEGTSKQFELKSDYFDIVRLFWKFGLSPYYIHRLVSENLNNFVKIYDYLESGNTFENFQEMAKVMKLEYALNKSMIDLFTSQGVSEDFVKTVLGGIVANFYNQGVNVNGFVGFVSAAGLFNKPFYVEEGNDELVRRIKGHLEKAGKLTIKTAKVDRLEETTEGVIVHFGENSELYDKVIIAASIGTTSILIDGVDISTLSHEGQRTYITIIRGKPKAKIEGVDSSTYPDNVLFTSDYNEQHINQISRRMTKSGEVFYIQSKERLTDEHLNKWFDNVKRVKEQDWKEAYPKLHKREWSEVPRIRLSERIFYNNGVEVLGSCMEMVTISARNTANLILGKNKRTDKKDEL